MSTPDASVGTGSPPRSRSPQGAAERAGQIIASLEQLARHARAVVDAVTEDECGMLVGGQYQGGHGGMLRRETLQKVEALRTVLESLPSPSGQNEQVPGLDPGTHEGSDGTPVRCKVCGRETGAHYFVCDIEEGEWCPTCFEHGECAREHEEGCATAVFDDAAVGTGSPDRLDPAAAGRPGTEGVGLHIVNQLASATAPAARAEILLRTPDAIVLSHAAALREAAALHGDEEAEGYILGRRLIMVAVRDAHGLPPIHYEGELEQLRRALSRRASSLPSPGYAEGVEADWQIAAFDATLSLARERHMDGLGGATDLAHLEDMRSRIGPQFSRAKLGRWLGWAQCAVVACGAATLEDMKDINRRCSEAARSLLPAGENTGEGETTRYIACGQYDNERHDSTRCPGSPHYNPASSTERASDADLYVATSDREQMCLDQDIDPRTDPTLNALIELRARREADKGAEPVGYATAAGLQSLLDGFSASVVAPAVADEQHNRALYAAPPAPSEPSEGEVMQLWREYGGRQHGPHVETATMPLRNFMGFIRALRAASAARGKAESSDQSTMMADAERIPDAPKGYDQ